ncbi:MAG: hypothetical protein ACOZQL_43800 [Myxococcota bacterium]
MGFLRFLVWTSLCIALGIFLGTWEIGGRTPWQLMQGAWKQQGPRLEKVKDDAGELVDGVKKKVSTEPAFQQQPKERHSKEDREAIDQLISKRTKG